MLTYFQNMEIKLKIFSYSYGIWEGEPIVKKGGEGRLFIGILTLSQWLHQSVSILTIH